ncbi:dihydroorotate dehydrogenase|uniref:Dihydroorotate dehydrogenase n=1 Tax=Dendrosporobacter quercicolus TaxID=146817 RepID=A0A1G9ZEU5_9FIRM|nr:dihydroorotate dehydrogenase [Dendrosporobacter quercicolus]NSL49793.1 dihydroorotate dehydrogenase [Dendrosporobacter quercicolus DSM 1736]SDN19685.1 dihydroorotate dehydrogenase (NAD+) catalytic subunit [Dendrosporobacter quercicolus]
MPVNNELISSDMMAVEIAGIKMKTPVMTASGTFGFGLEYEEFVDINQIGAIVVKGTTLLPRSGNAGVRIAETPAGMLNSIGLENPGVEAFLAAALPKLAQYDVPVIVNIAGNTVQEYGELAKRLETSGVAAVELNISCPNVKQGGIAFGTDCDSAAAVVSTVKASTSLPVIVKLSPNVTDIAAMAQTVEAAGADAISLINTLLGMAINIHTRAPVLGNVVGGLSGPAVKPVAVRMVWQAANAVKIPVIGMGGIMTAEDAVEFMLAGASAVAVGTANFVNPCAIVEITAGIKAYLVAKGLANVGQLVGGVNLNG